MNKKPLFGLNILFFNGAGGLQLLKYIYLESGVWRTDVTVRESGEAAVVRFWPRRKRSTEEKDFSLPAQALWF